MGLSIFCSHFRPKSSIRLNFNQIELLFRALAETAKFLAEGTGVRIGPTAP